MTADDPAALVERHECPTCQAPPGSPCRTRGGKVSPQYHSPRHMAVPQLRAELKVKTPADRSPGRTWAPGPAVASLSAAEVVTEGIARIGYARCSTATQELQSQLDALTAAGCDPIFEEKISTRVKVRPEFTRALDLAAMVKRTTPQVRVHFVVHELKRLGRGTLELVNTAEQLRQQDIHLELLTGPLQGVHDPSGHGAALFAFFAGMAESERDYIRDKTLEGQASARERGRHGGRPEALDADLVAMARDLYARRVPVEDIRRKLIIPTGKRAGQHPSRATVYRALAPVLRPRGDAEKTEAEGTA